MFELLKGKDHLSTSDLLTAAEKTTANAAEELRNLFHKKAFSYFAWLIKSITPAGDGFSEEEPDFSIYFKNEPQVFDFLRGADIPAKVLTPAQSLDRFYQSDLFVRNRGMIIVMQIDQNTPKEAFKNSFNSELHRIGNILYRS